MTRKGMALLLGLGAGALLWLTRVDDRIQVGAGAGPPSRAAGAGPLVFDLRDDIDDEALAAFAARHDLTLTLSAPTSRDEALFRAEVADRAAMAARLAGDPDVELVEPVVEMQALGWPDDPRYPEQWNLHQIGAAAGWRAGAGRGVTVAVLDTGVSAVEDLQGIALATGRSFVPGVDSAADDHGHGTHVAGTIAQATHNGRGVAGVAPGVEIVPYKVLAARGGGSSDQIAAAIDDAADAGVDIINMSLGGPPSAILTRAADAAAARGVLVVASAGNTGSRGLGSPADGHLVVAVAATGPDGTKAPYSTHGVGVEIAAPGGDTRKPGGGILQDTIAPDGGHAYREFQGTSMAAPHVSGALAVLLGMGIAPGAAVDVLFRTAVDVGGDGFDEVYGHGRIDLAAAVDHVIVWDRAPRFAAGALIAVALALAMGFGAGRAVPMTLTAAWAAGGLFFLAWLPVSPGGGLAWLALDPLRWPGALFGPGATHTAWVAAAWVPLAVTFAFGLRRPLAPWVAGLGIGVGVSLLSGALDGTLAPFDGGALAGPWLAGHAALCFGGAVLVAFGLRSDYAA